MVDSIGIRPTAALPPLTPATPVTRVDRPTTPPSEASSAQPEVSALAFDSSKQATVNETRVEDVRRAVRNGTYPISPETIADRLLALKLNWSPKK